MFFIYLKLIQKYGLQAQQDIAIEEMSELTKAIIKYRRKETANKATTLDIDDIAEEIADVEIMMEQLKIIYNCTNVVADYKEIKNTRIKALVDENEM
jgi:NTP pyrophosphatase (non-canonical NTP hydrolase)